MKNHILKLIQENLFLKTEQREKLRAGVESTVFLARNGAKVIQMLTAANAQEANIFREILKDDPNFFKNIKQENLREKLENKRNQESEMRTKESLNLDTFLDDEFANLEL